MRKGLEKSGIEYVILLRNWASVMSFCSHWRFTRKVWSFTNTLLIYIYDIDQTFKQGLGQNVGCMASKWIHKRTFIWNIPKVWLWEMSCNHRLCGDVIERPECYLLRLLHGQTTSTIIHLTFWFGITPTGFISSLSYCYGGRASSKFITRDSRFYDLLKRDNEDRGFQVQEDLLLHFCRLVQE